MDFWDRIGGWFEPSGGQGPSINPASGLPMINSIIDIHGNPFGTNLTPSASTWVEHHYDSIGQRHHDSWTQSSGYSPSPDWPTIGGGYDPSRGY